MRPTGASIVIASKSAPITSPTISSENGEIAAARRAITSLNVRYFSEKCEWARTSQTSARARRQQKNLRHPPEERVLQGRRQLKERRLRLLLQRQEQHLRSAIPRQQPLRHRPGPRLPL
jgi:hypothetical protein